VAAIGTVLITSRRPAEAVALLQPATDEFADLPSDPGVVAIRSQLARAHHFLDAYQQTLDEVEGALAIAERDDLTAVLADALVTKGSALASLGRVREGLGVIRIGEDVARANGHTGTVVRALNNRASFATFEVDAATSRVMNEELLEQSRRIGDRGTVVNTLETIGWIFALFDGDAERAMASWAEALTDDLDPADEVPVLRSRIVLSAWRAEPTEVDLARLDRLAQTLSEPSFRDTSLDARAWIALSEGRLRDARELWTRRLASVTDPFVTAMVARTALWAGDVEEAARWTDRYNAMGGHLPASEIRRRSLAAGLASLRGEPAEASARYGQVIDDWRRLGHRYEVALTSIDMATLLDPGTDLVRRAAVDGREVLEGLGATAYLAHLETAMARGGGGSTADQADRSAAEARPAG
jgi:tetratricopeptide (TPR) repeat protein